MRILTLLIFSIFSFADVAVAQQQTKLSRKEKKELKRQQQHEQRQAILDLFYSKKWVIEAHTVFDRYNQSFQLNPTINFVGVKDDEGALQLGFDGLIGWNGVGGVTVEGQVTRYEIREGKGNPAINLRFQGRGVGSANINVTVNTSGQATARVNGDFGDRITFSGTIRALDKSTVYKGQSLF